jgi:hypothetical protein
MTLDRERDAYDGVLRPGGSTGTARRRRVGVSETWCPDDPNHGRPSDATNRLQQAVTEEAEWG